MILYFQLLHCFLLHIIVPTKITTLTLTKAARLGRPALLASWRAPSSETSILSYQVQYKSTSSSTWKTRTSTSTSTYLESLSAGSTYQVYVRANSSIGLGPYSALKTLQTYTGIILILYHLKAILKFSNASK